MAQPRLEEHVEEHVPGSLGDLRSEGRAAQLGKFGPRLGAPGADLGVHATADGGDSAKVLVAPSEDALGGLA
eukprot:10816903-Alexandrium_andersonii.AAC.1